MELEMQLEWLRIISEQNMGVDEEQRACFIEWEKAFVL
jgi:hypothetical protein